MSMMPGNPCHKDADFPAPKIKTEKCRDCKVELLPDELIQGRCIPCHKQWLEDFINGKYSNSQQSVKLKDAIAQMDKSIKCLALELPESVWDDVDTKWEAVRQLLIKV